MMMNGPRECVSLPAGTTGLKDAAGQGSKRTQYFYQTWFVVYDGMFTVAVFDSWVVVFDEVVQAQLYSDSVV